MPRRKATSATALARNERRAVGNVTIDTARFRGRLVEVTNGLIYKTPYSLDDISQLIGVNSHQLRHYRQGESVIPIERLMQLCFACEGDPTEIFGHLGQSLETEWLVKSRKLRALLEEGRRVPRHLREAGPPAGPLRHKAHRRGT